MMVIVDRENKGLFMGKWINFLQLLLLVVLFLPFSGCGKHEAEGGAAGTVIGAAAGGALSSKKSKAEGTLLGAFVGNTIGRLAGSKEDRREERERHNSRVAFLQQENRKLKKGLERWCPRCHRKSTLKDARACTRCGEALIVEQYCSSCRSYFEPRDGYIYCPNCPRALLSSRLLG